MQLFVWIDRCFLCVVLHNDDDDDDDRFRRRHTGG
jgi:hypothetical protein